MTNARMVDVTAEGGGGLSDPIVKIVVDDLSTDVAAARVESVSVHHLIGSRTLTAR